MCLSSWLISAGTAALCGWRTGNRACRQRRLALTAEVSAAEIARLTGSVSGAQSDSPRGKFAFTDWHDVRRRHLRVAHNDRD
jgi:hypothetical protein